MWSDRNEGEDEDLGMDVYGEPMAILSSPTSSQQEEDGNEKTETRLSLLRTLKPICSCHLALKDVHPNFLIKAR
ncbi:BnaC04g29500D [Brassica napus]|uniref:BnaC04g29500D protein n=1 Tax=Brassica napus TaxID=3708 RepID=A0A078H773_BRANA|nr:BnaC04g29500D [Brassica napus]